MSRAPRSRSPGPRPQVCCRRSVRGLIREPPRGVNATARRPEGLGADWGNLERTPSRRRPRAAKPARKTPPVRDHQRSRALSRASPRPGVPRGVLFNLSPSVAVRLFPCRRVHFGAAETLVRRSTAPIFCSLSGGSPPRPPCLGVAGIVSGSSERRVGRHLETMNKPNLRHRHAVAGTTVAACHMRARCSAMFPSAPSGSIACSFRTSPHMNPKPAHVGSTEEGARKWGYFFWTARQDENNRAGRTHDARTR